LPEAAQFYSSASALFDDLHDSSGRMQAVNGLGLVCLLERGLERARTCFEETVALAREAGDDTWIGLTMINLGHVSASLGDLAAADREFAEAAVRLRARGHRLYESEALTGLASVRRRRGMLPQARELVEQALSIAREHNNPSHEASALLELTQSRLEAGESSAALISAQQAAARYRQRGDRSREATAWGLAGAAYRLGGALDEAIAFHQQAAEAQRASGDYWQYGVELDALAVSLLQAGRSASAREQWMKSLEAVAGFIDPEAEALRARVALALEMIHPE
jgi:tetratricopeptide (TPR) repeat protein